MAATNNFLKKTIANFGSCCDAMIQYEFEFAFKKDMVMLCREQRIEMFVKVDLDCRFFDEAKI